MLYSLGDEYENDNYDEDWICSYLISRLRWKVLIAFVYVIKDEILAALEASQRILIWLVELVY